MTTTETSAHPPATRAWLLAVRPPTLTAAAAPVVVASAMAHAAGDFRAGVLLVALAVAVLLQVGANLANDVFDFERGVDGEERLGPPRAAAGGMLTPGTIRARWPESLLAVHASLEVEDVVRQVRAHL
jgi:1,4-dihydroxy-2-naphthoate polyprenyltransferase